MPVESADSSPRRRRAPPPEIAELEKLQREHPELSAATQMQLALVELQRRVQARVSIPSRRIDQAALDAHAETGRRLLEFADIPLEWTELRRMVRSTVEILQRSGTLEDDAARALQTIAREPEAFPARVERWYEAASSPDDVGSPDPTGMLDQVLTLAMRPFLARCAQVLLPPLDLSTWNDARCPLCGGEPEFATIDDTGRHLLCGRCTGAWPFAEVACPFCDNRDRLRITTFASRDGRYRLAGCDVCLRYIKAFDGRRGGRGAILSVDTIATLPLDVAAVQRGYQM